MLRLTLAALLLAMPAHAADMAFFVKNLRQQSVAVELFSRDRQTVWPGDGKVFLIQPGSQKSVPISCNPGENICYGAWVNGNDKMSWGVGPDGAFDCKNCCLICLTTGLETIDLPPAE